MDSFGWVMELNDLTRALGLETYFESRIPTVYIRFFNLPLVGDSPSHMERSRSRIPKGPKRP